jgi:argininosuccinate lyase
MSRLRKDPDPRFWRLNRSIEFDWRLAPYDIDQSQAHARGLRGVGVLDDAELEQIDTGLERVRARMGEHGFEFNDADEDIHMAVERLLGEEIGPLAGKLHTGRSRNDQVATDVAMVVQAHSLRAIELAGAAMERLLALAASGRCRATPTCNGRSPSTSATTCSPTSGCSPATCCASSSPSTAPR